MDGSSYTDWMLCLYLFFQQLRKNPEHVHVSCRAVQEVRHWICSVSVSVFVCFLVLFCVNNARCISGVCLICLVVGWFCQFVSLCVCVGWLVGYCFSSRTRHAIPFCSTLSSHLLPLCESDTFHFELDSGFLRFLRVTLSPPPPPPEPDPTGVSSSSSPAWPDTNGVLNCSSGLSESFSTQSEKVREYAHGNFV